MQTDRQARSTPVWYDWLMIRPGEGRLMLYLAGIFLLFGLGLALGRGSSDALFFKRFGVEYLPQMFFATSLLLMAFSLVYAEYADRWQPGRMLQWMGSVLAVLLLCNWLFMGDAQSLYAYAAYYLIYAVASEIMLVHLGFYANSFLDTQQGKRLLPPINAAARVGAVIGGLLLGVLAERWPTPNIALLWVAALLLLLLAVRLWHAARPEPRTSAKQRRRAGRPFSGVREGLYFARRSPLLRISGWAMFLLIILVSLQDYLTSILLTRHFEQEKDLAAFFGWFFAASNALVLVMQLALTNRLLHRFGLRMVNLIFPVSTLLSFAALAIVPGFYAALLARFNYMGMLPAFRIPAANLFYKALPAYMQGRARALMVGLVLPAGLAISGLVLMLVPMDMVGRGLAVVGVVLAIVFLRLKMRKNSAYGDSLVELIRGQVFSDKDDPLQDDLRLDPVSASNLATEIPRAPDDASALAYANLLRKYAPALAGELLLGVAPTANIRIQDHLLRLLAELDTRGWHDYAKRLLTHSDRHIRGTALALLAKAGDPVATDQAQHWLEGDSPRLRATSAAALINTGILTLRNQGVDALGGMLTSARSVDNIAAAQALAFIDVAELTDLLGPLLVSADGRTRAAAVRAKVARLARTAECTPLLCRAAADESALVRVAVAQSLNAIADYPARLALLAELLNDVLPAVRQAALTAAARGIEASGPDLEASMQRHFADFRLFPLLIQASRQLDREAREPLLRRLAIRHGRVAMDKQQLARQISSEPDETDAIAWTLRQTLHEEAARHVEMALALLAEAAHGEAIRRLIPALRSRDRRLRAQGLESLQCLLQGDLSIILTQLLDDDAPISTTTPAERANLWQRVASNASTWLDECMMAYQENAHERPQFAF